jgi:glycosyltransferase involved in cell wall biosynthesis
MTANTTCMGLLNGALDNDSRPKRAFQIFSQTFDFSAVVLHVQHPEKFPYPIYSPQISLRTRGTSLRWILFTLKTLITHRPQVVLAEGLISLIPGALYRLVFSCKLIYDSRELYLCDQHGNSNYSDIHRFIERIFIRKADQVLTANSQRADIVSKHYNLSPPALGIQNIPKLKAIESRLPDEFSFLKNGLRYVVYQGHFGDRGLETFIDSMPHWPTDTILLLIVEGSNVVNLRKRAQNLGLTDRIKFHNFLPQDTLFTVLRNCHLGLICYKVDVPNNEHCAPNKLYEYAQCELPMLTTPQAALRDVFSKHAIGQIVEKGAWVSQDLATIGKHVAAALEKKIDTAEFKRFNTQYNWQNEEQKLIRIIEKQKESQL